MKILKFGGSSVGTPERVRDVLDIVLDAWKAEPVAVVVSAFQGITDQLIESASLAAQGKKEYLPLLEDLVQRHREAITALVAPPDREDLLAVIRAEIDELKDVLHGLFLVKELSLRTLDFIMSFGERFSARILSAACRERGLEAEYLDARKLVRTDSQFGSARVDFGVTNIRIRDYFAAHPTLQVITGFIGTTALEETTTLGRGGSDYSASIFGAALDVSEVQIWTDVDGVMTADPRKVPLAFSVDAMSYEEAMEMSHFGAKIIHPPTMQPARQKNIPILIKNTFHPEFEGTRITAEAPPSAYAIRGLSSISRVALLTVQGSGMIGIAGISSRLFGVLAKKGISVILISQASSEHSICVAVSPESAAKARSAIEEEFALEILAQQIDEVVLEPELAVLAIVGEKMQHTPGIAGRLFHSLGRHGVNVVAIAQGSSELNISVVVSRHEEARALNAIHDRFFFPGIRRIHVFLAGPGLIGGTLLDQIRDHRESLAKNRGMEIDVHGIFGRYRQWWGDRPLDLDRWRDALAQSKAAPDWEAVIEDMVNLPGSIFVDCTAGDELADWYERILKKSVPLVAANKKPLSGPYARYLAIRRAASPGFLYETTVGAGLPLIGTLCDLLSSGDEIRRVEAVLSGTLSYLFNTYRRGGRFSAALREAQRRGYTEPDPREDLSGQDVARKLLILAREIGLSLELPEIEVENLVPESCRNAPDVESFYASLEKEDAAFDRRLEDAADQGRTLRYIGVIENGQARVSLRAVGPEHPFFGLSGSDNIVSFTTERYHDTPLVVRGPGAGAAVTAAGVFADILRLGLRT